MILPRPLLEGKRNEGGASAWGYRSPVEFVSCMKGNLFLDGVFFPLVGNPKCIITQSEEKASWNVHVGSAQRLLALLSTLVCLSCDRRGEDIPSVSVLGSSKKTTKRSRSLSLRMVAASGACGETIL